MKDHRYPSRGSDAAFGVTVGCGIALALLAIKGAVLVGAVWLIVWALRAAGVL